MMIDEWAASIPTDTAWYSYMMLHVADARVYDVYDVCEKMWYASIIVYEQPTKLAEGWGSIEWNWDVLAR